MTHTGQKISFDSVLKKVVVENMSPMISSSDEIKKTTNLFSKPGAARGCLKNCNI